MEAQRRGSWPGVTQLGSGGALASRSRRPTGNLRQPVGPPECAPGTAEDVMMETASPHLKSSRRSTFCKCKICCLVKVEG